MKSFQNPAFASLDTKQTTDWDKLLKGIEKRIGEYSSAKDKYSTYTGKHEEDNSSLTSIQNRDTKFTHTATISTAFKNVQRVSQENAARLFGVKTEDYNKLRVGHTFKLPGNDMNDVKVTLLGKNSYDYHNVANPKEGETYSFGSEEQDENLFNSGKEMITGQDNSYKKNLEYEKMINKVESSDLIEQ